jgi:hypothetical protein
MKLEVMRESSPRRSVMNSKFFYVTKHTRSDAVVFLPMPYLSLIYFPFRFCYDLIILFCAYYYDTDAFSLRYTTFLLHNFFPSLHDATQLFSSLHDAGSRAHVAHRGCESLRIRVKLHGGGSLPGQMRRRRQGSLAPLVATRGVAVQVEFENPNFGNQEIA